MNDRRDAPVGEGLPGPAKGASDGHDRGGSVPGPSDRVAGDVISGREPLERHVPRSPDAPSVTEVLLPDTAALIAERDEYLGALQRMKADFDNYRKRIVRQQEEQSARAAQTLVAKVLPVLDTLDLAQAHLSAGSGSGDVGPSASGPLAGRLAGSPAGGLAGAAGSSGVAGQIQPEDRSPMPGSPGAPAGPGHGSPGQPGPELTALNQARAQLLDVLTKEGLERVDETDVAFDPEVHDAVAHAPAEPGDVGALVDEVMRAGYRWRGQVVRPAMVRVRG